MRCFDIDFGPQPPYCALSVRLGLRSVRATPGEIAGMRTRRPVNNPSFVEHIAPSNEVALSADVSRVIGREHEGGKVHRSHGCRQRPEGCLSELEARIPHGAFCLATKGEMARFGKLQSPLLEDPIL